MVFAFSVYQVPGLNLDGTDDRAVLAGISCGGVNIYYQMYLLQQAGEILHKSQADPLAMSNLVAAPESRALHYS